MGVSSMFVAFVLEICISFFWRIQREKDKLTYLKDKYNLIYKYIFY